MKAIYEFDHWLDIERNRPFGSDTSRSICENTSYLVAVLS